MGRGLENCPSQLPASNLLVGYNRDQRGSESQFSAFNRLPQTEYNVLSDEFQTVTETPGADEIPTEIYKAGGLPMADKLIKLCHCMWRKRVIPYKNSRMQSYSIYTNGEEILKSVTTAEASLLSTGKTPIESPECTS